MSKFTKKEIMEAVNKWPGYCYHWAAGLCHFPNTWKRDKRDKVRECMIKPGKENSKKCEYCMLDTAFEHRNSL